MMNQKAAELGMTHTHFVNACGLDARAIIPLRGMWPA